MFKQNKCVHEYKHIAHVVGDERNYTKDLTIFRCNACGKEKRFPFWLVGSGITSDGYHTFNELYHHRMVLFSVICNQNKALAWKSKLHDDGTMYDNYFIVGITTPEGDYTYHYHEKHWDMFKLKELERAPKWDGHKPEDITRLMGLLDSEKVSE